MDRAGGVGGGPGTLLMLVMVDALHVAALRDDLVGVQRYLERHLGRGA